jgi:hypothetical protein
MGRILLKGSGNFKVISKNNKILTEISQPNLIMTQGLIECLHLLVGKTTNPFKYLAIGEGYPSSFEPPEPHQTSLFYEIMRQEANVFVKSLSEIVDEFSWRARLETDFELLTSKWIGDLGVFNMPEGGIMLDRFVFESKIFVPVGHIFKTEVNIDLSS